MTRTQTRILHFLGRLIAASLTIISVSAATDTGIDLTKLNSAEKWVLKKITAGELADLRQDFADEEHRTLSAHFVERLLTGMLPGVKPHRNGVRIGGAVICEAI